MNENKPESKRYILTETYNFARRPRISSEKKPLEQWQAALLFIFEMVPADERADVLKTLGSKAVDSLCARVRSQLPAMPAEQFEGLVQELRKGMDARMAPLSD
jgi:hypothetical protein